MVPTPTARGRQSSSGLLRVALAATIWGSLPLFVRMVHANSLVIVFWRVAFGAAAFFVFMLVRGRLGEVAAAGRRRLFVLTLLGVLLAANWVLYLSALVFTDVAVAVLLGFTGPVFVAVLTPKVTGVPSDRRIAGPLLLSLAGSALIVGPGGVVFESSRDLLGAAMAFGSALTLAACMLSNKRLLDGSSSELMMLWQNGVASLVLLPAVLLLPGPGFGMDWLALLTLGVVHTMLAMLIFLSGLKRVRADQAGVLTYCEPVSAVLLAALFLNEPLHWNTVVGGIAIITAGLVVARLSVTSPGGRLAESKPDF